ncbi:MAG: phosphoglycerate dehydrogenase [Elusimicrobiota bacterium]
MPKPVLVTTSTFGKEDSGPNDELARSGLAVSLNPHRRKLTEAEVLDLLAKHKPVGMIAGVEPLTARVLESCAKHLRVISRCGTGMESVDIEAAAGLGMLVFNTPAAPAQAVAELAVGLMLAVLRRIPEADRAVREDAWERKMGSLLGGKTVGIVGYGRIGRLVGGLVHAFGCTVLARDVMDFSDPKVRRVSLEELLETSDIVTLHVPLEAGTRHVLSAEKLKRMKQGAILINASRGGLVDEKALLNALKKGRLAGAGLDTFKEEPYRGPLRDLPNVVLTAHMGAAAKECRVRMEREAAVNLIEGLRSAGEL